jgi:hypothetical protein
MRLRAATLAAVAWLVFAQAALAAGRDRLSYTGVEGAFGRVEFANSTSVGDRFDAGLSVELARPVFLSASHAEIESGVAVTAPFALKSTISRVDLGCHFGSDRRVNFVPSVSWVEVGSEFAGALSWIPDQTENGWAARAAFRTLPLRWLEVGASIDWIFIPDDVIPTGAAEVFFYPISHLGVGVGYESSEGNQAVTARARLVQ